MWILPTNVAADVVVRARSSAYEASFDLLTADVTGARTQLLRWRPTADEPIDSAAGPNVPSTGA